MSQRTLDGTSVAEREAEEGDKCGEAVMAAMQAISEHCETDGVPMQMANGMVTMVPKDEVDRMENMAPKEMSDRELEEMMDESPWMGDWTEGACKAAGLEEGTQAYRDCRLNFAREALE